VAGMQIANETTAAPGSAREEPIPTPYSAVMDILPAMDSNDPLHHVLSNMVHDLYRNAVALWNTTVGTLELSFFDALAQHPRFAEACKLIIDHPELRKFFPELEDRGDTPIEEQLRIVSLVVWSRGYAEKIIVPSLLMSFFGGGLRLAYLDGIFDKNRYMKGCSLLLVRPSLLRRRRGWTCHL
jgi:hypothetical protein